MADEEEENEESKFKSVSMSENCSKKSDDDQPTERLSFFKESPSLTEITREHITKKYRFEKVLGEGAQGKVKVASLRADESKKFAIKSIPRHFFTKEEE